MALAHVVASMKRVSQQRMAAFILEVFESGRVNHPSALLWYETANAWIRALAKEHNYTVQQVAAIVAVTSPLVSWNLQHKIVPRFLAHRSASKPGINANWEKAEAIRRGASIDSQLHGTKVNAFYLNLLGIGGPVTIDRHALRIALGLKPRKYTANGRPTWDDPPITDKLYDKITTAYKSAAKQAGVSAEALQAVCWVEWKAMWNRGKTQ